MGEALLGAKQPVVLDMEASIEHMRRATVRHVDTLLVVTEPYYRSLEAAGRLIRLAAEIPIPRILGIANKVRSPGEEDAIRRYLEDKGVALALVIPYDEAVLEADLEGRSLLDYRPEALAVQAIERVVASILS